MVETDDIKLVSNYTLLSFNEVLNLDCLTYRMLVRDALIYKMRKTQEGQEYLENCWILEQTNPDRKKLRKQFSEDGRLINK